jgi:hypothetical protein
MVGGTSSIVRTMTTDLLDRYRPDGHWTLSWDGEPLTPEAVRLLAAPLATFTLMMVVMASLFLVTS